MRKKVIFLVFGLLLIAAVGIAGCTSEPEASAAPEATPEPTIPVATPEPTAEITPEPVGSDVLEPVTTQSLQNVIYDQRIGVTINYYHIIQFRDHGVDFCYGGEQYEIEVESDKSLNVLFMQDTNIDNFRNYRPEWNSNQRKWDYRGKIVSQFDDTYHRKFVVTIPEGTGRYSLCLDTRNSPKDLVVARETAMVDVKITRIK
ncbi:MAG: hypothetical protein D5R96_03585 [Methanocalculus sp. MSAO_Arc2]|uniref:hypothetical protein n=1 Tax=Methanocalculus sp. MSAO_Arc2 TaxID=2293855 RepID=UPI000FF53A80|nr:MAG: hypothetical protein D5R96_03585 [Methanocalculus sp. MSAO_Arc2]